MNHKWLRDSNVTHIVNTAKGLEMFGPKYTAAVEAAEQAGERRGSWAHRCCLVDRVIGSGIAFLRLDWLDDASFSIPTDQVPALLPNVLVGLPPSPTTLPAPSLVVAL